MTHKNEIIRVGQIEIRFLLESKDTNGQLAMFEFTDPDATNHVERFYRVKSP